MRPSRNVILAAAALTVALVAVAFVPQLLGSEVRKALNGLSGARPIWLWAAGACFVATATRGAVKLGVVVLDSPDIEKQARKLLDLGFKAELR